MSPASGVWSLVMLLVLSWLPVSAQQGVLLPAVAIEQAGANNARLDRLMQELKLQVGFARLAVTVDDQQSKALDQLDRSWLEGQLSELSKQKKPARQARNGGFLQIFGLGVVAQQAVPIELEESEDDTKIRSVIEKKIASILTAEQNQALNEEKLHREQFRAEALAHFSVAILERHIVFAPEQIEQLQSALTGKVFANLGWTIFLYNRSYVPALPTRALTPILTPSQSKIYKSLNRNNFEGHEQELAEMLGLQVDQLDVELPEEVPEGVAEKPKEDTTITEQDTTATEEASKPVVDNDEKAKGQRSSQP